MYHDKDFKDLYILSIRKQGVTIAKIICNILRKQKLKEIKLKLFITNLIKGMKKFFKILINKNNEI